jgi:hypothetical protein
LQRFEITQEFAVEQIKKHGGIRDAAIALAPQMIGARNQAVGPVTVEKWLKEARDRQLPSQIYQQAHSDKLNRLAKLLDESNVPVESIEAIDSVRLKSWGVSAKQKLPDGTTEIVTKDLHSSTITLTPTKKYPEYPVFAPASTNIIKFERRKPVASDLEIAIIYPDQQFGFRRDLLKIEKLIPFHDDAAIDVALQITADLQPHCAVDIGDVMDFQEHSRWFNHVEFHQTTQPAIYRAARYLDERKSAAGPRLEREEISGGNHDERLAKYLEEHARSNFGIRTADDAPSSWPPFSMPWALNLERRGIRYHRYPGSEVWLVKPDIRRNRPGLLCTHARPKQFDYFASVINGHDHTIESETITQRLDAGRHVAMTRWSSGCLCRVDSQRDEKSMQRTIVPSDRGYVKRWKQGLVVVYIDRKTREFQVDQIHIERGRAIYQGRVYDAGALKKKVA